MKKLIIAFALGCMATGVSGQMNMLPNPVVPPPPPSDRRDGYTGPDMVVFDRDGYTYLLHELMFDKSGGGNQTMSAPDCIAGIFRLHFADDGTGLGFDDGTSGPQRQAVACQVFTDISQLLNEANSPYTNTWNLGNGNYVEINVDASLLNAGNGMLGRCGQFFLQSSPGIVHGSVWQTINSGIDAWFGINPTNLGNMGIYHGVMQINFGHPFYSGTNPNLIPGNEYDLYTVILHEAMHALGFGSLIASNGTSKFTGTSPGIYSYYDTFLKEASSGSSLINNTACYTSSYNTAVPISDLTTPCTITFSGTTSTFVNTATSWFNGTSLSHYDIGLCGNPGTYVMNPSLGTGITNRFFDIDEVTTLCDLRYSTSGVLASHTYPSSGICGSRIAGVNDFATYTTAAPGVNYVTPFNTPFIFSSTDFLGNDENANWYECVEVVNSSGTLAGSMSGSTGQNITFTPSNGFQGVAILKYVPRTSATGIAGNITYIFIFVQPPPLPPCNAAQCEMICYGDMEAFTSQLQYDLYTQGQFAAGTNNGFAWNLINGDNSPDFRNWVLTFPTYNACPGAFANITGNSGTNYVGLIVRTNGVGVNFPEGPSWPLNQPLLPLETATVTVWARMNNAACLNLAGLEIRFTNFQPCANNVWLNNCPGLIQSVPVASPALAGNTSVWQQLTFNYTNVTGVALNFLLINSLPFTTMTFSTVTPIWIDDISCTKNTPNLNITKTGPSSACPGDIVNYTITVCNASTFLANNVSITDILPTGMTLAPGGTFTYPTQNVGNLPSAACSTYTLNATVNATFGTLTNTVIPTSGGCLPSNSQNTSTLTVNNPTLQITTSLDPLHPCPGDPFTFSVEICNSSNSTINNIVVQSLLPGYSGLPGGGYTVNSQNIDFLPFSLGPGTVITPTCTTFIVNAVAGPINAVIATSLISGGNVCLTQPNLLPVELASCGDLTITKTVDKTFAYAGQIITYTITIQNNTVPQTVTLADPMTNFVVTSNSCNLDITGGTISMFIPVGTTVCTITGYYTHIGTYINCVTMTDQLMQVQQACTDPTEILVGCPMVVCTHAYDCTVGSTVELCLCLHNLRSGVDHIHFDLIYPGYLSAPDLSNMTVHSDIDQWVNGGTTIVSPATTYIPNPAYNHVVVDIYFTQLVDIGPIPFGNYVNPIVCFDVLIQSPPPSNVDDSWVDGYYTILNPLISPLSPALTQPGVIIFPDPTGTCFPQNNPPDPSFTLTQVPCTNTINVTATVSGNNITNRWEWGDNATTPVYGADSYTYTYDQPGTYIVTHTIIENGVASVSTQTVIIYGPCCSDPGYVTILDGDYSTPLGSGISGGTVQIQGTFYVDNYFTINNGTHVIMEPGARIVVKSGGILILYGILMDACSNMYKGIILESGGKFLGYRTTIKDADQALFANDKTEFYVIDCDFDDNIVGIETPTNPVDAINNISYIIVGTKFHHTGILKQPFTGQNPYGQYPKAGIIFYSMAGTIGMDTYTENSFDNMNCGIITGMSNLSLRNNKFTNIINEQFYPEAYMGSAIASRGGRGFYTVTVSPYVNQVAGDPTMSNCDFGLYTDFINTGIKSVMMEKVGTGIYITRNTHLMTFGMTNCDINAINQGVYLYDNKGSGGMYIGHSIINTSHDKGTCVLAEELTLGDNNLLCERNIITSYGSRHGVYIVNCDGAIVQDNEVSSIWPSSGGWKGVSQLGCVRDFITCNNIYGSSSSSQFDTYGIYSSLSDKTSVSCNNTNLTKIGIEFDGINAATDFKANKINDHFEGLHLNSQGVIGTQTHKGNEWIGPFNSSFGGNNLNFPFGLSLSKFEVHTSASPFNPNIPAYDLGWFNFNGGVPAVCVPEDCEHNAIAFQEIVSDLDKIIADGTLSSADYLREAKEMAKQYLYRKLNQNPSLMNSDAVMQDFYAMHSSDEIGKLNTVKDKIEGLTYYNDHFAANIETIGNTIEGLRDTIIILDSIYIASNYNDQDVIVAKEALLAEMNALSASVTELIVERESLRSVQVEEAISENSSIASNEIPETNERLINSVYLDLVASGINSLRSEQVATVEEIANQCPFSGGRAVYQARSIYKLIKTDVEYDDVNACRNGGIYRKGINDSRIPTLSLFPNPAKEIVTIDLGSGSKEECILIMSDVSGNVIKRIALPCDQPTYTLDISGIANGMYIIRVLSNQVLIGKAKLGISN